MYNACSSAECFIQLTTLHLVFLFLQTGVCANILGMAGRKDAALNFTKKKKIPRKAPWGELPGRSHGEDTSPL